MADDDKEQIQHDVDHTRQGEEVQGAAGVALRPQQGGTEVIDHGGGHPQEVDPQIQRRQVQYIVRSLHPDQNGPGPQNTDHRQEQAAEDT